MTDFLPETGEDQKHINCIVMRIRALDGAAPTTLEAFSYTNAEILKEAIKSVFEQSPDSLQSIAVAGPFNDSIFMLKFRNGEEIYPHRALELLTGFLGRVGFLKFASIWHHDTDDLAWRPACRGVGFEGEWFDDRKFEQELISKLEEMAKILNISEA
jgi:hypothetical protein